MRVKCPKCGTLYDIDTSFCGETVECDKCHTQFMAPTTSTKEGGLSPRKDSHRSKSWVISIVIIALILIPATYMCIITQSTVVRVNEVNEAEYRDKCRELRPNRDLYFKSLKYMLASVENLNKFERNVSSLKISRTITNKASYVREQMSHSFRVRFAYGEHSIRSTHFLGLGIEFIESELYDIIQQNIKLLETENELTLNAAEETNPLTAQIDKIRESRANALEDAHQKLNNILNQYDAYIRKCPL